jgi:spore germination protein YaaH
MIDFEALPPVAIKVLRQLPIDLHARLAPKHRVVSVTVPVDDENWSPRAFAQVADKIVLMAYDEHLGRGHPARLPRTAGSSRTWTRAQGHAGGQGHRRARQLWL